MNEEKKLIDEINKSTQIIFNEQRKMANMVLNGMGEDIKKHLTKPPKKDCRFKKFFKKMFNICN